MFYLTRRNLPVKSPTLFFDGDSSIDASRVDVNLSYSQWSHITLEATVLSQRNEDSWNLIIGERRGNNVHYGLTWDDYGSISFRSYDGEPKSHVISTPDNAVFTNTYVHVAVKISQTITDTTSTGEVWLYVNGVGVKHGLFSNHHLVPEQVIMGSPHNNSYFQRRSFRGHIGDVRIWNYLRTDSQIKHNAFRQLSGREPGLMGYWPLNEGQGVTSKDCSLQGHDATLNNVSWNDYQ